MKITSIKPAAAPFPEGLLRAEYTSAVDGHADWAMVNLAENRDHWMIVLHGHGSHGDQLYTREDIRDSWLPLFKKTGYNIVTPNLRDNAWMCPAALQDLYDLTQHIYKDHHAKRIILISGSMGGTSNLIYAGLHPQTVQGVIAMCPATDVGGYHAGCRKVARPPVVLEIADAIEKAYGGTPAQKPEVFRKHSALANAGNLKMPIYVCHGDNDDLIPVEEARALATTLGGSANFRYDELPGGGHDTPLWKMTEALDWLTSRL